MVRRSQSHRQQLIGSIYSTCLDLGWPTVLAAIADEIGATAALIGAHDNRTLRHVWSARLDLAAAPLFYETAIDNPWLRGAGRHPPGRLFTTDELVPGGAPSTKVCSVRCTSITASASRPCSPA